VSALDNAKEALARHESQNRTDPFHFGLTDHMYLALRDLVAEHEHERVLAERAAPQEWEYGWRDLAGDDFIAESRGVAERFVAYWGGRALRRIPERRAGDWEPLPEDADQTEGGRDA
jgi:hypothetical protein